jgi:hypothetical protein
MKLKIPSCKNKFSPFKELNVTWSCSIPVFKMNTQGKRFFDRFSFDNNNNNRTLNGD